MTSRIMIPSLLVMLLREVQRDRMQCKVHCKICKFATMGMVATVISMQCKVHGNRPSVLLMRQPVRTLALKSRKMVNVPLR